MAGRTEAKGWWWWHPSYKVPRTLWNMVAQGLLKDKTWEGSPMPHFETTFPDGSELVLWVDHPDVSRRFLYNRYEITLKEPGDPMVSLLATDSLSEILAALRQAFKDKGGPQPMD